MSRIKVAETMCPICGCVYLVLFREVGDRCGDRSHYYDWPENQFDIPEEGCPGIVIARRYDR